MLSYRKRILRIHSLHYSVVHAPLRKSSPRDFYAESQVARAMRARNSAHSTTRSRRMFESAVWVLDTNASLAQRSFLLAIGFSIGDYNSPV